jgi:hypothetical protein
MFRKPKYHEIDVFGIPDIKEHEGKIRSREIRLGLDIRKRRRQARRMEYWKERVRTIASGTSWSAKKHPGLRGLLKRRLLQRKRAFRGKLNKLAHLRWGIIEPVKGTGHKAKTHEEWECKMNFVAQGWDPTTGGHFEVPPGRWDLDAEEYFGLFRGWPREVAEQYMVERKDPKGPFSLENIEIKQKD